MHRFLARPRCAASLAPPPCADCADPRLHAPTPGADPLRRPHCADLRPPPCADPCGDTCGDPLRRPLAATTCSDLGRPPRRSLAPPMLRRPPAPMAPIPSFMAAPLRRQYCAAPLRRPPAPDPPPAHLRQDRVAPACSVHTRQAELDGHLPRRAQRARLLDLCAGGHRDRAPPEAHGAADVAPRAPREGGEEPASVSRDVGLVEGVGVECVWEVCSRGSVCCGNLAGSQR